MDFQQATRRSKRLLKRNGFDSDLPVARQSVEPVQAHFSSFRPLSTQPPIHRISIHSLPLELVRSIVEQDCLTHDDLRSLALSSSSLRDEAQRTLFKDPGELIFGNISFSADKFLDSIIASPKRLAPMVRVYSQVIDWQRFRNTARKTSAPPTPKKEREARQKLILGKVRRALQLMVNLKHLAHEERSRTEPLVDLITSVLTDKCSFQLTSLVWTYVAMDGIQEELDLFRRFLPRQSALRSLCFTRIQVSRKKFATPGANFYAVARSVCPQLEDLSAPLDFVISVLPVMAAIKRFSWPTPLRDAYRKEGDIRSTNLVGLANSLETLEILDFHRGRSVSELVLISSHLKSLVLLAVNHLDALTPTILSKLPCLRVVTITLEGSPFSSVDPQVVESALLQSPSLTYIDISNVRGGQTPYHFSYSGYWCWRYSLSSDNALTSRILPIEEHFDWDTRRSFRMP